MSHSTNYPPSIEIELGKSHDCEEEFKIRKSSEEKLLGTQIIFDVRNRGVKTKLLGVVDMDHCVE